ncbi:MAG: biopolymer transporter ExbD [Paraburkholderia sp.]|uniref:ExbD/TolR family protein n=1 Tax=Paraburkholderia sp. TaxID=1926495 RepID=UPI0011F9FE33|nr:biopolymer transporter ExbD [Paraburkholderia sp.]TAM08483.1 MAG: biopolymer transporter ExbD [Paraburkholderia sp.]TAM30222.1 MAG: biopolymer transporter ExbD [Paraburkholderia sp.]
MIGDHSNGDMDGGLAAEINMTPLIDVMLVLLVVFMVTLPAVHHAAKIALPQASSQRENLRVPHVDIMVDAGGHVRWDGRATTGPSLEAALEAAAKQRPQPELRIIADHMARYGEVARLLSQASAAGVAKVGFVTDPVPSH